VINAGIDIMESFLDTWPSVDPQQVDGDVQMADTEQELQDVKHHVNNIRPDIERNPWLSSIIKSF
jgi:hypothetical protein